jgi:hypothetical protein
MHDSKTTAVASVSPFLFWYMRQPAYAPEPIPIAIKTPLNGSIPAEKAVAPAALPKKVTAKTGNQQQLVASRKARLEARIG